MDVSVTTRKTARATARPTNSERSESSIAGEAEKKIQRWSNHAHGLVNGKFTLKIVHG